ncbi:hypothetical protein FRB90_004509 [Tulasnella sp. 427]|nr:hypothetical protein FRB90_004509 [Tulasnella sp. 427]
MEETVQRAALLHPSQSAPSYATDTRAYNSSIYRLPQELFVDIFIKVLEPETRLQDLIRLAQVCRVWRLILVDAEFLWATINGIEGNPAVSIALERAGRAPLFLEYRETHRTVKGDVKTFLQLAAERATQMKSIVVELQARSWSWDDVLGDLQRKPMPRLEVLHLRGVHWMETEEEITLFGSDSAPAGLQNVTLGNIAMNFASLHLNGLKSLDLHQVPDITSVCLMSILVESPCIETVTLSDLSSLTGWPPSNPDQHQYSNILLAHLRNLVVYDLPTSFLNLLFSSIKMPELHTLELTHDIRRQTASQVLSISMGHQLSTLAAITSNIQNYKLTLCSKSYCRIKVGGLDVTLYIDAFSMDHFLECFDWLSKLVSTPLKDLPLELDLDDLEPDPFYLEWFTRQMIVTKLTVYSEPYFGDALLIIPFLGRPTVNTPVTWLVPQVEVFQANILKDDGYYDIVEMLRRRYSSHEHPGLAAPRPFREIRLSFGEKGGWEPPDLNVNLKFLTDVAQIARGADVYWEDQKWPDFDLASPTTSGD